MIPYGKQSIDDDDVAAVVSQLRSDWLTQGPAVERFERALAEYLRVRHVVAVSSGTAALHLACLAAGLADGDVAVTSPITFVASVNCVRYAGAQPALADVDASTGLIAVDALAKRCEDLAAAGSPPKAIIPVDFAGQPANLPAVRAVAARYGAVVIEDAAHSLGATYQDGDTVRKAADGHHADMATLSFHPVKHVTTGEGGAITTNDPGLYRRLADLRTHGITKDAVRMSRNDGPWYYEQQSLGFNYRISDIQCALGASQLRKLDGFVARRREIARAYDDVLSRLPLSRVLEPLATLPDGRSAHHLYIVRVRRGDREALASVAARRRSLYEALRSRQIAPQVHYIPVHHQPVHRALGAPALPNADAFYAGCLSIPMFPAMTDEDVTTVIAALESWAGAV
ncbi:MAG: UDP-4-amino-4,6-dideoxy-N-acetyl-beta-L-altrosamine transaminase [Labilithrix sp.]|nr:UDP-4-amino-4,6-dideoxy-N-acetyl-beta-L-altrosamine transaminase [Labilithrix sp.]